MKCPDCFSTVSNNYCSRCGNTIKQRRDGKSAPYIAITQTPQQAAQSRYQRTPLGEATYTKYNHSEKGRRARAIWDKKKRDRIRYLRELGELLYGKPQ